MIKNKQSSEFGEVSTASLILKGGVSCTGDTSFTYSPSNNKIIVWFVWLWWKITDNGRRSHWAILDEIKVWKDGQKDKSTTYTTASTRVSLKDFWKVRKLKRE